MVNIQHKDGNINAYILVSFLECGKSEYQEILEYILSEHKHNYSFTINLFYKNGETISTNLFGFARLVGFSKQLKVAIKSTLLEVDRYANSSDLKEVKCLMFPEIL